VRGSNWVLPSTGDGCGGHPPAAHAGSHACAPCKSRIDDHRNDPPSDLTAAQWSHLCCIMRHTRDLVFQQAQQRLLTSCNARWLMHECAALSMLPPQLPYIMQTRRQPTTKCRSYYIHITCHIDFAGTNEPRFHIYHTSVGRK
jgi:hypothetical protein